MKKLHYIFTFFIITAFLTSCENSTVIKKPEDVGKHTMTILKKMDQLSLDEYIEAIFTIEDVKTFGKDNAENISEKASREIENFTPEQHNFKMERTYSRLKEATEEYGIVWEDIIYEAYTFEERELDSIKGTKGSLTFKHEDASYTIEAYALLLKDGTYKLIELRELQKK